MRTIGVSLTLLLASATGEAAHPRAKLAASSIVRFNAPLRVTPQAVSEALAAQDDPLSVVKGLHLYLQGGHVVPPDEVRMGAAYCRVDVDLAKANAAEARAGGDDAVPVTSAELVIASAPLKGDPHDYGGGGDAVPDEKARHGLIESRWRRYAQEAEGRGVQQGRSIEVGFREAPDNWVNAIVCFKKGAEYPNEEDFGRAFGGVASLEPGTDASTAHAPTAQELREAAARARAVGGAAPDFPRDDSGEKIKDRSKRDNLKTRKVGKQETAHDLDDALAGADNGDSGAAEVGVRKSAIGGVDWVDNWGDGAADADAAKSKKRDGRVPEKTRP
jgi:hypothetical protein